MEKMRNAARVQLCLTWLLCSLLIVSGPIQTLWQTRTRMSPGPARYHRCPHKCSLHRRWWSELLSGKHPGGGTRPKQSKGACEWRDVFSLRLHRQGALRPRDHRSCCRRLKASDPHIHCVYLHINTTKVPRVLEYKLKVLYFTWLFSFYATFYFCFTKSQVNIVLFTPLCLQLLLFLRFQWFITFLSSENQASPYLMILIFFSDVKDL